MPRPDVRTLRARLGLTQPQCAAMLGLTGRSWQNYEAGRCIPRPVQVLLLLLDRHPELAAELLQETGRNGKQST